METTVKPSTTSPQYAALLRRIMLIDRLIKTRNDDYVKQLDEYIKLQTQKSGNKLTEDDKKTLTESFTRGFYSEEMKSIGEYEAIAKRQQERIEPSFRRGNEEQYEKDAFVLSLGLDKHVAQSLFSEQSFKSLSSKYPDVAAELKKDIRKEAEQFKGQVPPSAAHFPATVSLFNKRYPGIKEELEKIKIEGTGHGVPENERNKMAAAALSMLKVGSTLANPSGYLISKAVGGLMQTKAMKPLVQQVKLSVNRVAEKTGLKEAVKKQLSKFSGPQLAAIGASVAAVGVTVMYLTGALDAEKAMAVGNSIYSSIADIGESAYENAKTITVGSVDFASNIASGTSDLVADSYDRAFGDGDSESLAATEPSINMTPDNGVGNSIYDEPKGVTKPFSPPISSELAGYQSGSGAYSPGVNTLNSELKPESFSNTPSDASAKPSSTTPSGLEKATPTDVLASLGGDVSKATPEDMANELSAASSPAASPVTPSATTLEATTYKIKPGDSLSEIVEARLQASGTPYTWETIREQYTAIAKLNGIDDPDVIFAGKDLKLPPLASVAPLANPVEISEALSGVVEVPKSPSPALATAITENPVLQQDPLKETLSSSVAATHNHSVENGVMSVDSEALRADLSALGKTHVSFPIVDETGKTIAIKEGTLSKLGFINEGVSPEHLKVLSANLPDSALTKAIEGNSITLKEWESVQAAAAEFKEQNPSLREMRSGIRR